MFATPGSAVKVMFLIRSLDIGGAETQLSLLARGLRSRGEDVSVAVYYGGGPLERDLKQAGIPVFDLQKLGRWDALVYPFRLLRLVRRVNPDILHSYMPTANITAAAIKKLIPDTRVVWGVRASDMDLRRYGWLERVVFAASVRLAGAADLIVANSQAGYEYHKRRGYPERRMRVVENGVDVERFRPDEELRRRQRAQWNIGDRECVVGMVARVDPMKDHETFLQAAGALHSRDVGYRFACIGSGEPGYENKMRERAEALIRDGVLVWEPARPDVERVYPAFDIAVNSSAYGEGFSNVVGEAMACGVPCVVTDVGDAAHIVNGQGAVIRARDAGALASAVEGIRAQLEADRSGTGARVRGRVVAHYGIERLVSRSASAYRSLLGGGVTGA